jgi:hypothetical protein
VTVTDQPAHTAQRVTNPSASVVPPSARTRRSLCTGAIALAVCAMGLAACSSSPPNPTKEQVSKALVDNYGVDEPDILACTLDELEAWTPTERQRILDNKGGAPLADIMIACRLTLHPIS